MFPRQTTRIRQAASVIAGLLALGVAISARANATSDGDATVAEIIERAASTAPDVEPIQGWSISLDNDLFALSGNDRDYTGGFGVTLNGARTADYWWSLDPALERIDRATSAQGAHWRATPIDHSVQVGLLSFTPQDLVSTRVIEEDRPYASLLFVTSGRQYLSDDARAVRYSGLTLGVLGLPLTSDIHAAIHRAIGSDPPRGYRNQISAGGEPTLRYVVGQSKLRGQRLALGRHLIETTTSWELSAGYITEASVALTTRVGDIQSPWWAFNPERGDYLTQSPATGTRAGGRGEFYVWAGAKLRLRAYNAFLQGQFRDSVHTIGADDLNHLIGEAWIGVTTRLSAGTQLSYAVRYQTAEIRDGLAKRSPVWAGLTITHSY